MTTTALRIGTVLLGAVLCLPPALAQEGRGEERTLRHAEDGATTTLTARPEGDSWRVELTRERASEAGASSEQRLQLVFPRADDVDRQLEDLFQGPPEDPDDWVRRLEELAPVDIDIDADVPDTDQLRELSERLRDEMRRGFEQAREQLRDLLERARGDEGAVATEPDADRVWLKDGAQVSGELLSVDATTVRLQTPTGEVTVPRDEVRRIELRGRAAAQPILGVAITDQPDGGVRVVAVRPGTPAEKAGLRPGDVIVSFDGQPVRDSAHLRQVLAAHAPGDSVTVSVRRGEQQLDLQVDLSSMPAASPPRDGGMGPY